MTSSRRIAKYSIEHGSYYLRREGSDNIELMCDQVGIAYMDEGILVKHGDYKKVETYAKENGVNFLRLPRGFPVDIINRCIENGSYLPFLLRDIESGKYDDIGSKIDTL